MKSESFQLPIRLRHVAIITSGYLPVPNVLGGAVEALDMMLIRENAKNPRFTFTVFSCWAQGVEESSKGIRNTQFSFIKSPWFVRAMDHCIYWVAKYLLHKQKLMSYRYIIQRLWYIYKVAREISRDKFDALIIENNATLFIVLKLFDNARRYTGKVYYHLHNEIINDFGCAKEISSVRKVLGVSNYIVDALDHFLREHGERGLEPWQRAVWHNCVDVERFNPDNSVVQSEGISWRNKLDIQSNETVFLFSGRLTPEKGASELLEAFLNANLPNTRLVIVGAFFYNSKIASPFERRLHQIAKQAGKKIVFTGFVEYNDMPGIYAMADICVLPSIWNDPAPLAVIESLASGRPLITTQSGGIPEYVNSRCAIVLDRHNELLKSLTNAMITLTYAPNICEDMKSYSRVAGKLLSPENYLDSLSRLIQFND